MPPNDPLFVAESIPNLAGLENMDLLRSRALILENIDGFDQPPVFRGVPHIFDDAFTPPFGWSASFDTVRDLANQAIVQHFPRTLNRIPGVDFRPPTEHELDALEAFMNSFALPVDGTDDLDRFLVTDAQKRGRDTFFDAGCGTTCHIPPLFTDGARLNTGVVNRAVNVVPPPECEPPCGPIGPREQMASGSSTSRRSST